MNQTRESWSSNLGFILAGAGSAIGLGNIWRFPYMTGKNGGGAFLLVYLFCVFFIGLPVLIAEVAMGRRTQKSPIGAYQALRRSWFWPIIGGLGVLCGLLILSYYSVIAGWTLGYLVKSALGTLSHVTTPESAQSVFLDFIQSKNLTLGYHALFIFLCFAVVIGGVRGGIERWSRILLPVLFLLLLVLAIRSLTLDGAAEGLRFYLTPDISKINLQVSLAALGQGFFTLSLGMGAMITYGSYLGAKEHIPYSSFMITIFNTSVSLLAGLVIFPAVFVFGFDPAEGPSLVFQVLPAVFSQLPAGQIFAVLFFVLLVIAALTSGISLLEVVVSALMDQLKWSRGLAVTLAALGSFVLGIPIPNEPLIIGAPIISQCLVLDSGAAHPNGAVWSDGIRTTLLP